MTASLHSPGQATPLHRQLILKGLLPMTLVAFALTATLGVLHMRTLGSDAQSVARIQAIRLASSATGVYGDDALRDALGRALSRSAPTARIILRREDAPDLVIDSGRLFVETRALHVRMSTVAGELETVSDASALFERRWAAGAMFLLLSLGVLAVFMVARYMLMRDVLEPLERIRVRIETFLHPRGTQEVNAGVDDLRTIDGLLDELLALRARHDVALSDALRQRLQDIARHARFVEQVGDHFRQPLQALGLFVAGMQPGDDLRQRAVLGQMRSNLARLNEVLDSSLEMARFDAGAIEPAPVDLIASDLFVRVRAAVEDDASRLGVTMHWRGGRLSLHADPFLLADLLQRLVSNAVLSTPGGRVLVAVRRRGHAIRLEVRDNGMGLDPSVQARVFEELTRLPGHPGYGLGLAVARRIADTLGGAIGVRSRPGFGTLFWAEFASAAVGPSVRAPGTQALSLPI